MKKRLLSVGICFFCIIANFAIALAEGQWDTPAWRLDNSDKPHSLRSFRMDMENLTSGSGQPNEFGFEELYRELSRQAEGPLYMVDLRQESHAFVLDEERKEHLSWHTKSNAANQGMGASEVMLDEEQRFGGLAGQTLTAEPMGNTDVKAGWPAVTMTVKSWQSEEKAATQAGFRYARIAALDMKWPEPQAIDEFLELWQSLPENAWLHLHCHAGHGRTTTFMVLTEMLRHPERSVIEVCRHQQELGGSNLLKNPERLSGLYLFKQYINEELPKAQPLSWSEWLDS